MTGTSDDRQAHYLENFWNTLRNDAATEPPPELDPATAEFARELDRELRPPEPTAHFVASLRTRMHDVTTQDGLSGSASTDIPPAMSGVPRPTPAESAVHDNNRQRKSLGRELLKLAAAIVAIALVAQMLNMLFRDNPERAQPTEQTGAGAGILPPPASVDQIAYSAYDEDGVGKRLMLADTGASTTTPITPGTDDIYVGMPTWSPDGRYVAYIGPTGDGGIMLLDVVSGKTTPLPGTPGAIQPRWSPDGLAIAYVGTSETDSLDLYVVEVTGDAINGSPRRLTVSDAHEMTPVWSPDGSMLAFAAVDDERFDVYVIRRDGSDFRRVNDESTEAIGPNWSPDGMKLAYSSPHRGNAEIYVADLPTGDITNITNSPTHELYPVWSPDGESIAFTLLSEGENAHVNLWVMDADGSNRRELIADDAHRTINAVWSPDGDQIAATLLPLERWDSVNWSLVVVNRDGSNLRVLSERAAELDAPAWRPGTITDVLSSEPQPEPTVAPTTIPALDLNISDDRSGDLLAPLHIGGGQVRLFIIPANGSPIYQLIPEGTIEGNQIAGAWSPDGSQVAMTIQVGSARDIYVVNADGSDLRQLAPVERTEPLPPDWIISQDGPAWSPDGTTIAFSSNRSLDRGGRDLYIVNADGSNLRRMTDDEIWESSPRWSPDGSMLALEGYGDSDHYGNIYVMNADGSDRRRLVETIGARDPNWSLDGEWLAYTDGRFGSRLNIVRPDGTEGRGMSKNSTSARWPRWSPDGSMLAWSSLDDGGSFDGIAVYDVATGDGRLISGPSGVIEWSANGRWIAVAMPDVDLAGTPTGAGGIYLFAADGSEQIQLLKIPIDEDDIMLDWRAGP